tara:strand:+ start:740 stop:1180 length:441 start_codon:yes stop_codon:yes gene_type:complete
MTDIKSIQRLLVVQTVYEQTLNKNREDIKVEELFSDIIKQSSYKDKLKKSNLNFAKALYIGLRKNHVGIGKILLSSLSNKNKLKTMDKLLLSIFKVAIFELMFQENISKKIVISEYLMIANRFFEDSEIGLLNGVLDNLQKFPDKK